MPGGAGPLGFAIFAPAILGFVAIVLSSNGWTIEDLQPSTLMKTFLSPQRCGLLREEEFVITSRRVVFPVGIAPAAVLVKDGKIAKIAYYPRATTSDSAPAQNLSRAAALSFGRSRILDFGEFVISPGLIDTHVHMNEPGRVDWEGMWTATRAAAAGGITTVIDMPLNSWPCSTTAELLRDKIAASKGKLAVDAGFWGGIIPANAANHTALAEMVVAGALGFKSFMPPSGMDDFPNVSEEDIRAALPYLRKAGVPYYVHAEVIDDVLREGPLNEHSTWLNSRPRSYERNAITILITALKDSQAGGPAAPNFRVHVAHLADSEALPDLAAAKVAGLPLSVETCPHYLYLAAEDVGVGDTRFKCAPPLRERANIPRLWKGLTSGIIDSIGSDHSPSPPALKLLEEGNFMKAWGGIAGIQYGLPITWTGMRERGLGPETLSKWWSAFPAQLAGLQSRKGVIKEGLDADFVVWDPETLADTSSAGLQHRHKLTPYVDRTLLGRVMATFVRGQLVFLEAGQAALGLGTDRKFSPKPCGRPLLYGQL